MTLSEAKAQLDAVSGHGSANYQRVLSEMRGSPSRPTEDASEIGNTSAALIQQQQQTIELQRALIAKLEQTVALCEEKADGARKLATINGESANDWRAKFFSLAAILKPQT